jgi:uncharacterized membrane protein
MEKRPKLNIELTAADKAIEAICLLSLIALWISTVVFFPHLPDQIPTHFNASGEADVNGSKTQIFTLPAIATILYIGLTIVNRHPHIYNYVTPVTAKNARQLYTFATRLIRALKLVVVLIFSGIVLMTFHVSLRGSKNIGWWFLPLAMALMALPVILYLVKMLKDRINRS